MPDQAPRTSGARSRVKLVLGLELVMLFAAFWLWLPDSLTRVFAALIILSSVGMCSMIVALVRAFFGVRLDPFAVLAVMLVCVVPCLLLVWQLVNGCYLHHGICS